VVQSPGEGLRLKLLSTLVSAVVPASPLSSLAPREIECGTAAPHGVVVLFCARLFIFSSPREIPTHTQHEKRSWPTVCTGCTVSPLSRHQSAQANLSIAATLRPLSIPSRSGILALLSTQPHSSSPTIITNVHARKRSRLKMDNVWSSTSFTCIQCCGGWQHGHLNRSEPPAARA
jgi:hypothetical protein